MLALAGGESPIDASVRHQRRARNPWCPSFLTKPLPHECIVNRTSSGYLRLTVPPHPHSTGLKREHPSSDAPYWQSNRAKADAAILAHGPADAGYLVAASSLWALGFGIWDLGSGRPPGPLRPASVAPTARGSPGWRAEAAAPQASCVRAEGVAPSAGIVRHDSSRSHSTSCSS